MPRQLATTARNDTNHGYHHAAHRLSSLQQHFIFERLFQSASIPLSVNPPIANLAVSIMVEITGHNSDDHNERRGGHLRMRAGVGTSGGRLPSARVHRHVFQE